MIDWLRREVERKDTILPVVCWSRESLVEQARLAVTDQPQRALKSLSKAPANTVTSVYKSTTTISNKLPVMTLAQRVPELEAAPEPRESSQTPSEQQSSGTGLIRKTEARRSPPGGAASSGSNNTAS
jgi:hypothetical protein